MNLLAFTIREGNGVRIAEVGFLLGAIAGALFAIAAVLNLGRGWNFLAGIALAAGSVLLIIASHWGHFG
jgi:MFS family permease